MSALPSLSSYKIDEKTPTYAYTVGFSLRGHRSVILTNNDRFVWRCQRKRKITNGGVVLYMMCVACEGMKRKVQKPMPHLTMFRDNFCCDHLITNPNDSALLAMHVCSGDAEWNRREQRLRNVMCRLKGELGSKSDGDTVFSSDASQSIISMSFTDEENAQIAENSPLLSCSELSNPQQLKYQECIEANVSSKSTISTKDVMSRPYSSSSSAPFDLRPAGKLQLVSNKPFTWMTSMSAPGVVISKANIGDFNELLLCGGQNIKNERLIEALRAASIYYQYPELTGISLFPRSGDHVSVAGNFRNAEDTRHLRSSPERFFSVLNTKWSESFNDLCRSWRLSRSPMSFYVFCPQFTVLFTKNKSSTEQNGGALEMEGSDWKLDDEDPQQVIIVNHTLQEFRDALKKKDIDYYHVGYHISKGATLAEDTTGSAIAIWNPSSIENFCTFFLHTHYGRLTTGPQAGLPPTLVSASPFLNSSIKSLSLSSRCFESNTLKGELKYILELDEGPILPHTVENITKFLQRTFAIQNRENVVELVFSWRNFYTGLNQAMDKEMLRYRDIERCEFNCTDFSCLSW